MSNHSPGPEVDEEMKERLSRFFARTRNADDFMDTMTLPGPTGTFPAGKITEKDSGAYVFEVGIIADRIVLNFGKPIAWIGMTRKEALMLAAKLKKYARRLKG